MILQDIYIIYKTDILYDDVNETLFTWIINNALNINENGYYIKLIELTDNNIDTIASLNVKTLPALLIDSEVKTHGGNKIKQFIIDLVTNVEPKEHENIKKPAKQSNNADMNDWILEQLQDQTEDNGNHIIEEAMDSNNIMQKTQEMRIQRENKTPAKPPKRQMKQEKKTSGPKDADDILLDKMFDNQQIT